MGALVRKLLDNVSKAMSKQKSNADKFDVDVFHGTGSTFDQFADDKFGTFVSKNPSHAETYAPVSGGTIMPLKLRSEGFGSVDFGGRSWAGQDLRDIAKQKSDPLPPLQLRDSTGTPIFSFLGERSTDTMSQIGREMGLPGIRFDNVYDLGYKRGIRHFADDAAYPHDPQTEFVVLDNARLRLPWAKFEDLTSKSLTAGGAPVGIGGIFGALGNADDTMGNNDRSRAR